MDFELVFEKVITKFKEENIRYGLIGGFALGVMGILRATMDIDFLLLVDDLEKADNILTASMYKCLHKTENLSQYSSDLKVLGSIDIIHASRRLSREMLARVDFFNVFDKYSIPVLSAEDLIGLKVQAITNDASREAIDFHDMRLLLEYRKRTEIEIDWELLAEYFVLFERRDLLNVLKKEFT